MARMANLLALETSSRFLSVAVKKGRAEVKEGVLEGLLTHAENLLPMIDKILEKERISIGQIDAFVIGRGPGSFTGLRIGFATLKGFLAAGKKDCFAAPAFDTIAQKIALPEGSFLGIGLDAHRGKIYSRFYRRRQRRWAAQGGPRVLPPQEWVREFPAEIHLAGDALDRYGDDIQRSQGEHAFRFLDRGLWSPRASTLIEMLEAHHPAVKRLKTPRDFVPLYFRLPEPVEKMKAHALRS